MKKMQHSLMRYSDRPCMSTTFTPYIIGLLENAIGERGF